MSRLVHTMFRNSVQFDVNEALRDVRELACPDTALRAVVRR